MLYARDFRELGRNALVGRWGLAIGTGFVATLLGASMTSNTGGGSSGRNSSGTINQNVDFFVSTDFGHTILTVFAGMMVIILIWAIVGIIIGGATTLGYAKFNLNLVDNQSPEFSNLFSQYNRLGAGFCMQFLRGLYIFLWTLLFIIPGIIAVYKYAMTPYILAEHPEYGANEAITESKELMEGNKWRLFCLEISFIGWAVLALLTLGIGYLWLKPYIEASRAAFYREISKERYSQPIFEGNVYPNEFRNDNLTR